MACQEPPEFSQPIHEDPRAQLWQERVWQCLLAPTRAQFVTPQARVR